MSTELVRRAEEAAIVQHGTPEQRERWESGVLPDDELETIARVELFQRFAEFPRWATSKDREKLIRTLKHEKSCVAPHEREPGDLEFDVCEVAEMKPDEWAMFKKITLAVSITNQDPRLDAAACQVATSQHWITCKECGAEVARISAKVTIAWAGRVLVREYSIDPERYKAAQPY